MPGSSSYAAMTKDGKKVCIISDSIAQRINLKEFNNQLVDAKAFKQIFPGASVDKLKHYIIPTLEEGNIDAIVINIGSNSAANKHVKKTDIEITAGIMDIVELCHKAEINEI